MKPDSFTKRRFLRDEVIRWVVTRFVPAAIVLALLLTLAAVAAFFYPTVSWLAHLLLRMTLSLCGIGIIIVVVMKLLELLDKVLWKLRP